MRTINLLCTLLIGLAGCQCLECKEPKLRESPPLVFAPNVPPPITRREPAIVEIHLQAQRKVMHLAPGVKYEFWTWNGHVPGPFYRVRVGDIVEVHLSNADGSGMPHNLDLHAVTGPGGGAQVTTAVQGEEKIARFRMLHPGLFIYHCGAPPVMNHIANGMYGMLLVEPKDGLPKVEHEYYVMQSEIYATSPPADAPAGQDVLVQYSHDLGLAENPTYVVFNGSTEALQDQGALKARAGDRVRIFFGNIGPNKISSLHVIGELFDDVYREGDLMDPPAHGIQTTLVPAGGSAVVDLRVEVPGDYTIVDHAIFRTEKGAVGFLHVDGNDRPDLYQAVTAGGRCPHCKIHP